MTRDKTRSSNQMMTVLDMFYSTNITFTLSSKCLEYKIPSLSRGNTNDTSDKVIKALEMFNELISLIEIDYFFKKMAKFLIIFTTPII